MDHAINPLPGQDPGQPLNDAAMIVDGDQKTFMQDVVEASRSMPVLVDFWATWCAPCVQEMPYLDSMAKELPEIVFVGIGIDTAQNIAQFVAKLPVSYRLLVAGHAGIAMVRELGNSAGGLPFTLLFDANGSIFDSILGQVEPVDLRQRVDRLVAKSKT